MKKLVLSAVSAACGLVASATEYTVTSPTDPMPELADGDKLVIDLSATGTTYPLVGDRPNWKGTVDLLHGLVLVTNVSAIGTSRVYVTNETYKVASGVSQFIFDASLEGTMDIASALDMGSDMRNAKKEGTFYFRNGTFNLRGAVTAYKRTAFWVCGCTLNVHAPITSWSGSEFFCIYGINRQQSTVNLYAPLLSENGKCYLWVNVDNWASRFPTYFHCTGSTIAYIKQGGSGEPVYTTVDNALVGVGIGGGSASNSALCMEGHDQTVGELGWDSLYYVCNETGDAADFHFVQHTSNATNAIINTKGHLNFIKDGAKDVTINSPDFYVNGTLEVLQGALRIASASAGLARKIVVRTGGVLDLGGGTFRCQELEMAGGLLRNGTLVTDTSVINAGSRVLATVRANDLTGSASSETPILAPAGNPQVSTDGLVFCYHFDSTETLARDAGPNGYDLATKKGAPACDANVKKFGAGSLYLNGSSSLQLSPFPAKMPTGDKPFTVAFAYKGNGGNRGMGLFGYGTGAVGRSNNFSWPFANAPYAVLHNYWWDEDMQFELENGKDLSTDPSWHTFVATWDGTTQAYYYDGMPLCVDVIRYPGKSRTLTTAPDFAADKFYVGEGLTGSYAWKGWIDELAAWDRAITADEAAAYHRVGVGEHGTTLNVSGELKIVNGVSGRLRNGLVGHWGFDSEAALFDDDSGNGYALVTTNKNLSKTGSNGAVTYSRDTALGSGGSASFNGGCALTTAGCPYPAKLPSGDETYTVGFFFKSADATLANPGDRGMIGYGKGANNNGVNHAFLKNYQSDNAYWWNFDMTLSRADGGDLRDPSWHSVVEVWNNEESVYRAWIDGVEVTPVSRTSGRTINSKPNVVLNNFFIGCALNSSFWYGNLDEVTIWNRALTADEAAYFGTYGLSEPAAGVVSGDVQVGADGVLSSTRGTLALDGSLVANGSVTGDLVLKDGVTVKGETNQTMEVSGTITVEGAGTFEPLTTPTQAVKYEPFAAAGGYADGSEAKLADWTAVTPDKPKFITQFRLAAEKFCVEYLKPGMILLFR